MMPKTQPMSLYRAPNRNAQTKKKLQARQLRRASTKSEETLWRILRANGIYRFQRQKVILGWIFDFWCSAERIVIELDGSKHDYSLNERKDAALHARGIKVLRIASCKVFEPYFEDWFWKAFFRLTADLKPDI